MARIEIATADILDMDILHDLHLRKVDPSYWRTIYMYDYHDKWETWPMGFAGIHKPMRKWYRHLHASQFINMAKFPFVAQWTQTRAHPMEVMAAKLFLHVIGFHGRAGSCQWPIDIPLRTRQTLLSQCLTHENGFSLFNRMALPLGPIDQYQSLILAWLGGTGFFGGTSNAAIDQWIHRLDVPMDWLAAGLLAQCGDRQGFQYAVLPQAVFPPQPRIAAL